MTASLVLQELGVIGAKNNSTTSQKKAVRVSTQFIYFFSRENALVHVSLLLMDGHMMERHHRLVIFPFKLSQIDREMWET